MLNFILTNNILLEVVLVLCGLVLTIMASRRTQSNIAWPVILAFATLISCWFIALHDIHSYQQITFSGLFVVSPYIMMAKLVIISVAIAALTLTVGYFHKKANLASSEFIILFIFAVVGMCVLLSANDLMAMYLGLELQAIALYSMVASDRQDLKSSEAGLKYLIVGVIASAILLYGISLIYGFSGTTNFSILLNDIYPRYAAGAEVPVGFYIGITLILMALCIKLGLAPFHFWIPDVYQGAPLPVTAIIATLPKIAILMFFIRALYLIFYSWGIMFMGILKIIVVLSLFIGALGALRQRNIKRLLAYSAISHIGFVLLGIISGSSFGGANAILYISVYATMNFGLFALISILQRDGNQENYDLEIFAGLAKNHPILAFSITALLLSMAGIPPMAGFFAKFYVIMSALDAEMYVVVVFAVISTIISVYYYLSIIKLMYFDQASIESKGTIQFQAANMMLATFSVIINCLLIISPTYISNLILSLTNNL